MMACRSRRWRAHHLHPSRRLLDSITDINTDSARIPIPISIENHASTHPQFDTNTQLDDSYAQPKRTTTDAAYETRITSLSSQIASRATTPPLGHQSPHPLQTPLLLTPKQKEMIRNLNHALTSDNGLGTIDGRKREVVRVIAWFDWAYNSHAVIIVR
jgi:hypothetical protein